MPIVAIVSVVAVIVVGITVLGRDKGPSYPTSWDPRVQAAVTFVEGQKGRDFKHPVYVDFYSEADFVAKVTKEPTAITDKAREEAAVSVGELRALGLVQGDVDLLQEQSNLRGAGTAAYYSPQDKRVNVRGTDVSSLALQGTIVHELTHAWQDQNFDLQRLPKLATSQERDAFRTIAEGDAVNSEHAWRDKLSAADRETFDEQSKKESSTATGGMKSVPDVLIASMGAPYQFGPSLLRGIEAERGTEGVDDTFQTPPVNDDQIMTPWGRRDFGVDQGREVKTPATPNLEPADSGTFGALFWYLMLAEHIDPHQALAATDGWAGDAYAATKEGDKVCVHARIEGDDPTKVGTIKTAVNAWAAMLPHVKVGADDTGVNVDACDPGKDAKLGYTGRSSKTIEFPVVRLAIWAQSLEKGDDEAKATCQGKAFAVELTLDDLNAEGPLPDARLSEIRTKAKSSCR